MPFDPPGYRRGDPISAIELNRRNAELRRLARFRGDVGINVRDGVISQLSLDLPDIIAAKLTSTADGSGAYAWSEQILNSSNTWVATGYTGTQANDPAFERRTGDTGLTAGDKIFKMRRSPTSGSWLFAGVGTPGVSTGVSGTLLSCNASGVPGTIQIKDGGTTLYSGSTNGSGGYTTTFSLASTRTLTFIGTPNSARLQPTTTSYSITAGTGNTGKNIQSTATSGWTCTKACTYPINNVLTLTSTGVCNGINYPSDTLTFTSSPPAWLVALGETSGWLGTATWNATYGAVTGTWTYFFRVPPTSAQLNLERVDLTAHIRGGLATNIFGACPGVAVTPTFTCSTNCAIQQIGVAITEH